MLDSAIRDFLWDMALVFGAGMVFMGVLILVASDTGPLLINWLVQLGTGYIKALFNRRHDT
jgi:hypothetical protein